MSTPRRPRTFTRRTALRLWALVADVDEATVERRLRGDAVRPRSAARIDAAARVAPVARALAAVGLAWPAIEAVAAHP
jgi:hypothetical protein